MKRSLLVTFVGAPGTGKTTMCKEFAKLLPSADCILEDTEKNLYLSKFYENPRKWAFHSRISIFAMHLENYTRIRPEKDICFMDKCIPELIVYAKRAYEQGHIDEREFALYNQLFAATNQLIPQIDLFVYLSCSADTCHKRIIGRGRDFEKNVSVEYLNDVIKRYDDWADSIANGKILRLNTDSELNYHEILERVILRAKENMNAE